MRKIMKITEEQLKELKKSENPVNAFKSIVNLPEELNYAIGDSMIKVDNAKILDVFSDTFENRECYYIITNEVDEKMAFAYSLYPVDNENIVSMKFYEFSCTDFGYYALIGAETKEEAMEFYQEIVCDIEEEDGTPSELTTEEAKTKLLNVCKDSEQENEASRDFEHYTKLDKPYLILIDSSLV